MINIEEFTFYYADTERPALKDINLEIRDGEFVLITGPSGGGKSSLCRCLNGLIPHFYGGRMRGKVEVNGLDISKHPTRELATRVGMVFQDPENQLVTTDVEREIAFGLENLAFPRSVIARRIEEALDAVGIPTIRHRQIHELSGGEKQKVAIASVLALHPDILVLDEPTSELDPRGAEEVLTVVERLNNELGITVILIEHRLDRVVHYADRIVLLDDGHIVADGEPREIFNNGRASQIGVGVPPIIELSHRLKDEGFELNHTPLTVKEGRIMLDSVFRNSPHKKISEKNETKSTDGPVIEIKNLYHTYREGITALQNVNLVIYPGEFVAIMGRNASGKTTLVKHLNGLLKPTKGEVMVNGTNTREATIAELAREVGFIFQNPNQHLLADTVEEEVTSTLHNLGVERDEIEMRTHQALERLDLIKYRHQYPRSLSGGERQRVALASVIAAQPRILVLDEPTRGMEYRLKDELMRFLNRYRQEGNTIILVSHDVETIAGHAERVVLMSEGKVIADGSKRDILSRALFFSPQINRLAQAFTRYGIPQDLLTVEEVMDVLI